MIRGELPSEPLLDVLPRIAAEHATGALHLLRTELIHEEGHIFVHSGQVYAASAGHERLSISARLMSSHGLSPQALEAAMEAQAGPLSGWRIGEILVHLGYVDPATVEAASRELLLDAITYMSTWSAGSWQFVMDDRTRTMVSTALPWNELEPLVRSRVAEWNELLPVIQGAHGIPLPVAVGMGTGHFEESATALFTQVDGLRTVAEVAHDRGLSVLETGRVLASLSAAGAVSISDAAPTSSAHDLLEALRLIPDPPEDPMAPVVDLSAAREARAADEAARAQARRDADDLELADAARRSAQAIVQERLMAEQAEAAEVARRALAQAHERAEAALADQLAAEQAQQLRASILEAERAAQLEAETQTLDAELSLADALRSVNGPSRDTSELAAALSAALDLPTEVLQTVPPSIPEPEPVDYSEPVADISFDDIWEASELLSTLDAAAEEAEEYVAELPLDEPILDAPTEVLPIIAPRIPVQPIGGADMASLFRELSSLGGNEPSPAPAQRFSSPRPPGSADPRNKKKKGLFGR